MARGRPMARFDGIGVSPGIAVGNAYLFERQRVRVPKRHITDEQIDEELGRFQSAVELSEQQIRQIRDGLPKESGGEHALILDAHMLMLKDVLLIEGVTSLIKERKIIAEWAVWKTIQRIKRMFSKAVSEYFRERSSDVDFIGDQLLRNLVAAPAEIGDALIPPGAVIIAHDLSPADTAELARLPVKAIVTEVGSRTSHVAIVARSFEIPAVLGVPRLVNRVWLGDPVVVDGFTGEIFVNPSRAEITRAQRSEARLHELETDVRGLRDLPAETKDGCKVNLRGNIELPGECASVGDHGGIGVGLYRTEFLYISRPDLPSEEEHYETYRRVLTAMAPHPVVIRTLDVGGDKVAHSLPSLDERNPVLGLRAIRLCMRQEELFRTQLRALMRASTFGNMRILIPMVSGMEEIHFARRVLDEVRAEVVAQGHEVAEKVPLGTMIEVPSIAAMADVVAREVDFFSVGTNDLIQYTLAIDRGNEHVAYLYHPLHPAILRSLRFIVASARDAGIGVSLCGEMAADPINVPVLVGLGYRELSMSAVAIPYVKRMIRATSLAECEALAEEALAQRTTREVEKLVRERVSGNLPEFFRRGHPTRPQEYP